MPESYQILESAPGPVLQNGHLHPDLVPIIRGEIYLDSALLLHDIQPLSKVIVSESTPVMSIRP